MHSFDGTEELPQKKQLRTLKWTKPAGPKCNSCPGLIRLQSTSKLKLSLLINSVVHHPDDPGIFRLMCRWVSICTSESQPLCLLVCVQIDNKIVTWQCAQSLGIKTTEPQELIGNVYLYTVVSTVTVWLHWTAPLFCGYNTACADPNIILSVSSPWWSSQKWDSEFCTIFLHRSEVWSVKGTGS